ETILSEARHRKLSMLHAEQEVAKCTHDHLGFKIAELWKFPEIYANVIRHHHSVLVNPLQSNMEPYRTIVAVHIANSLSPLLGDPTGGQIKMDAVVKAGCLLSKQNLMERLSPKISECIQQVEQVSQRMFGS